LREAGRRQWRQRRRHGDTEDPIGTVADASVLQWPWPLVVSYAEMKGAGKAGQVGPSGTLPLPEGAREANVEAQAGGSGLQPGTLVGKYRIVERLGQGGMGVVYRAEHVDLGMLHALKTLAPELAQHPLARTRFLKEAKAAARIHHPHVVRIYDSGTHEGVPYFVMEHLEGEDLQTALSRTRLTVEQAAGIMLAVCAAIDEMHEAGLIHRDLKPGNIFLTRNTVGNIVPTVLDFGIVKPVQQGPLGPATDDGVLVGTPAYIAPEQLADLPAGEKSDQYALGVVLYRCVTGRLPFEAGSTIEIYRRIASHKFPAPREIRPELPADFERAILVAMDEHPKSRFPSVFELGRALLPFASAKQRAVWSDYYGSAKVPKASLSMPIPVAASSTWLPRIRPAMGAQIEARAGATEEILPPGAASPDLPTLTLPESLQGVAGGTLPQPLASPPVPEVAAAAVLRRRPHAYLVAGGAAIGVSLVAVVALLASFGRGPGGRGSDPVASPPVPVSRDVAPAKPSPTRPDPADRSLASDPPVRPAEGAVAAPPSKSGLTAVSGESGPRPERPVRSRPSRVVKKKRESHPASDGATAGATAPTETSPPPAKYPAVGRTAESKYPAVR
jgi:serine/threonine-protein kinase